MLSTRRFGPRPRWRVDHLDARQDEVGGTDDVDDVDGGPGERPTEHEGDLDLDERVVERAAGDGAAFGDEPIVEQRAVVGFGGSRQRAHRLRREPDLVAFDDAPAGHLVRRDGKGDAVGVLDVGVGVLLRDRRDESVVELGPVQGEGGIGDLLVGQHPGDLKWPSRKARAMMDMSLCFACAAGETPTEQHRAADESARPLGRVC